MRWAFILGIGMSFVGTIHSRDMLICWRGCDGIALWIYVMDLVGEGKIRFLRFGAWYFWFFVKIRRCWGERLSTKITALITTLFCHFGVWLSCHPTLILANVVGLRLEQIKDCLLIFTIKIALHTVCKLSTIKCGRNIYGGKYVGW